jgi:hypothetical protein
MSRPLAVVPEGLVVYYEDAQWWTGGPEEVENDFKAGGFPCVSCGYLRELEDLFRLIREKAIKANASKSSQRFKVRNSVLVFEGVMDASADSEGFIVTIMIMRPCCMGQGFARLMLYWMARMCYAFGVDMRIRAPTSYTTALIQKAFGNVTDVSERHCYITLPHSCLAGAYKHLGIKPEWFIIEPKNDLDFDLLPEPPCLNRGSLEQGYPFPSYDDLSSGQAYNAAKKRARV